MNPSPIFCICRPISTSAKSPASRSIRRAISSSCIAANSTGPAYGAAAAQLLEFDANGDYLREIGHHLYAWSFAHTVKVDAEDNVWVTDKGSDMVIKFNPEGRVDMVFGRKQEASDEGTAPLKHPNPPLPARDGYFRQVTDVAWDKAGNTFISDGYINSRVAKLDKDGDWLKSWGERGTGSGQFHTPHSIALDARGLVYVADRSNRRIQVFDGDGAFVKQFTIDAPVPPGARPAIGDMPGEAEIAAGTFAPGSPWAICFLAAARPGPLCLRRLSRPHLQADAGGQVTRDARPLRQEAQAVRLDSRDGLPEAERALRGRASQLARAEAHARLTLRAASQSRRGSRLGVFGQIDRDLPGEHLPRKPKVELALPGRGDHLREERLVERRRRAAAAASVIGNPL